MLIFKYLFIYFPICALWLPNTAIVLVICLIYKISVIFGALLWAAKCFFETSHITVLTVCCKALNIFVSTVQTFCFNSNLPLYFNFMWFHSVNIIPVHTRTYIGHLTFFLVKPNWFLKAGNKMWLDIQNDLYFNSNI